MQTLRFVLVTCLAIVLAGATTAGDSNAKLMKEVEAIGDAISKAMAEDDFDFLIGLYTDDAISLPNFGPRMQGVETFKKHHAEMSASGMEILSFDSQPSEVWACGDQVIEIGSFEISLNMPGMPGPIDDRGKYMTVYERQADGSLKIKAETRNTDMDPMAMGAMGGGEHKGHKHPEHPG